MTGAGIDIEGLFTAIDGAIDGWFERIEGIQQQMADDPCRAEVELGTQASKLSIKLLEARQADARIEALLEDAVATAIATRGESPAVVGVQSWPEYAINTGAIPTAPLVVLAILAPGAGPALAASAIRDLLPPGRPSGATGGTQVSPGVYLVGGELRGPVLRQAWDTWAALAQTRAAPASAPNARARLAALPVRINELQGILAELQGMRTAAAEQCAVQREFIRDQVKFTGFSRILGWGLLAWLSSKALGGRR